MPTSKKIQKSLSSVGKIMVSSFFNESNVHLLTCPLVLQLSVALEYLHLSCWVPRSSKWLQILLYILDHIILCFFICLYPNASSKYRCSLR